MIKIALLFLTISDVNHEAYWKEFLKGHDAQYSLYVHSKNGVSEGSFFKPFQLPYSVPTTWANTMKAQAALLREAVKDPGNQKFIFLTETTIPIRDFETIYRRVFEDQNSIFDFVPNPHLDQRNLALYNPERILPLPAAVQYKNSSWIILNRKHAELLAQDSHFIELTSQYPIDNEHYPSTFLAMTGHLGEVTNRYLTLDFWAYSNPRDNHYPFTFYDLQDELEWGLLLKTMQSDEHLFARKFTKECDLSRLVAFRKKSRGKQGKRDSAHQPR